MMSLAKPFGTSSSATARVFLSYAIFLILVVTLVPFRFSRSARWPDELTWSRFDFAMNVILFLPLGFLLPIAHRRFESRYGSRILLAGLVFSACIELTQVFSVGRTASALDLMANGLGAWLGWVLLIFLKYALRELEIDRLGLAIPLMNAFYLLTPVLVLRSFQCLDPEQPSWRMLIPIAVGGILLASVMVNRLEIRGVLLPAASGIVYAGWLLGSSLFLMERGWNTLLKLMLSGLGIYWLTLLLEFVGKSLLGQRNRRFEQRILLAAVPLVFLDLILDCLPASFLFGDEFSYRLGLSGVKDNPNASQILRLLESMAGFTLLGYLLAEWEGRWVGKVGRATLFLLAITGFALGLEILVGYVPGRSASLGRALVKSIAGVFGGLTYVYVLSVIQQQRPVKR